MVPFMREEWQMLLVLFFCTSIQGTVQPNSFVWISHIWKRIICINMVSISQLLKFERDFLQVSAGIVCSCHCLTAWHGGQWAKFILGYSVMDCEKSGFSFENPDSLVATRKMILECMNTKCNLSASKMRILNTGIQTGDNISLVSIAVLTCPGWWRSSRTGTKKRNWIVATSRFLTS